MEQNEQVLPLDTYLNRGVRNVATNAMKAVAKNPKEALFVMRMTKVFSKSEKIRARYHAEENLHVPTFLISSIATDCNLACKGCYARANKICKSAADETKDELTAAQWKTIFQEAVDLGINFNLLAGGEPLMRRDVIEAAGEVKNMVFPIFTNGTLMTEHNLDYFAKHLNLIPIISLEGDINTTDNRRGKGVYQRVQQSMLQLKERKLFFGTSITVTSANLDEVTSEAYLDQLQAMGCKVVVYVEYVPTEAGTETLALSDAGIARMESRLNVLRSKVTDMVFLSFPGDEKAMGGCLAAGRGFMHISPNGRAEACPFSPYSDSSVVEVGVKEALRSPFFHKLRMAGLIGGEHTGGCTLFEHEREVKEILNKQIS